MKIIVMLICAMACMRWMPLSAQEQGIQFDKSMSWKEVVEKAARENKYIYMDVMATWCPPCQAMINNVFTTKEAGDFYNEHFVCVKLQTDKTKKDDDYVKAWYDEAERICKEFKIRSLPTSLYFNSKGEIVHVVVGAAPNAEIFIQVGKAALDENQQVYTRLKKYEQGKRDVEFLYALSVDLKYNVGDMANAVKVANTFWQTITPEEQLLDKGIRYAADFLVNVDDTLFNFFVHHSQQVNKVMGEGSAESKVVRLLSQKYVDPLMRDSVNHPDWTQLCQELSGRYPTLAESIKYMLLNSKLGYSERYHLDEMNADALEELLMFPQVLKEKVLVPSYAYKLGLKAYKKEQLKLALERMEGALDEQNAWQLLDYAEILFLDKQDGKGRKCVNKALEIAKEGSKEYERAEQMKKDHTKQWKVLKTVMNELNQ